MDADTAPQQLHQTLPVPADAQVRSTDTAEEDAYCTASWIYRDSSEGAQGRARAVAEEQHYARLVAAQRRRGSTRADGQRRGEVAASDGTQRAGDDARLQDSEGAEDDMVPQDDESADEDADVRDSQHADNVAATGDADDVDDPDDEVASVDTDATNSASASYEVDSRTTSHGADDAGGAITDNDADEAVRFRSARAQNDLPAAAKAPYEQFPGLLPGPVRISSQRMGPRTFANVDHAGKPRLFACLQARAYFPALLRRYNALSRCSVEASQQAVAAYGEGAYALCTEATYEGCQFDGAVEQFSFSYSREIYRPSWHFPEQARSRMRPFGGGALVVLPPERTAQLPGPLEAWRASPPGLFRRNLPAWARRDARCLSCDAMGAESSAQACARGRCLEENLVIVQRLGATVLQRDAQVERRLIERVRTLYLQTPRQWRVLHWPAQAFAPKAWEEDDAKLQLLLQANLDARSTAHLAMCHALTQRLVHPGRLVAHGASCMERAKDLLSPATYDAFADDFAAVFAEPAQAAAAAGSTP